MTRPYQDVSQPVGDVVSALRKDGSGRDPGMQRRAFLLLSWASPKADHEEFILERDGEQIKVTVERLRP